jgi:hypothetical protein
MTPERITEELGRKLGRRQALTKAGVGLVGGVAVALGLGVKEAEAAACSLCLSSWSNCVAYCTGSGAGSSRFLYSWRDGCYRCYECFVNYNPGTCWTCRNVYCSMRKYIC